mmetsp:Transcript_19885/g.61853  ORF Transcript_19885/g.61853 Transcript_19885/m.61853 type:complete len:218 (-) Transcript_19885:731-1384(-)
MRGSPPSHEVEGTRSIRWAQTFQFGRLQREGAARFGKWKPAPPLRAGTPRRAALSRARHLHVAAGQHCLCTCWRSAGSGAAATAARTRAQHAAQHPLGTGSARAPRARRPAAACARRDRRAMHMPPSQCARLPALARTHTASTRARPARRSPQAAPLGGPRSASWRADATRSTRPCANAPSAGESQLSRARTVHAQTRRPPLPGHLRARRRARGGRR